MGGGYCAEIEKTVSVHQATVAIAAEFCRPMRVAS